MLVVGGPTLTNTHMLRKGVWLISNYVDIAGPEGGKVGDLGQGGRKAGTEGGQGPLAYCVFPLNNPWNM